jgi:NTP pyrophosphatase (non-canonical NTP hydrolase)
MEQEYPSRQLDELARLLRDFAHRRSWEQYHTPKNLALALASEVGELLALFRWLTPDESMHVMEDPETVVAVRDELADVTQFLIRLADVLGVDLDAAVRSKIALNEARFPTTSKAHSRPRRPDESLPS